MKGKKIEKPEFNPKLFYGEIIQWNFRTTVTPEREKYCYRFTLTFANGKEEKFQKSGFDSKASANKAKEMTIAQLYDHTFIPFSFTVKEFYDYWLYYHMIEEKEITYNTYMTYRNIIYNYFLKAWGVKKKINELSREDLIKALEMFETRKRVIQACGVLSKSMSYAKSRNVIAVDASNSVIRIIKNKFKKKEEEEFKNMDADKQQEKYLKSHKVLTVEQAAILLWKCKEEETKIFLPLLFTITAGLRISESLAIKFSDIDFVRKELNVNGQMGRSMKDEGLETTELGTQKIKPKTKNGYRSIPIPDFVIDEIVIARKRYDTLKYVADQFYDYEYVCFQDNGKPYTKELMYKSYKKMLSKCNLPELKWHELRHTYSTLLAQHGISMKAISVCMGHFSEGFTRAIYVVPERIIFDVVEEINQFAKEVLPSKEVETKVEISEKYILEVLPQSHYNKITKKLDF